MIQIFGNITELTSGRKLYDITPKIKYANMYFLERVYRCNGQSAY